MPVTKNARSAKPAANKTRKTATRRKSTKASAKKKSAVKPGATRRPSGALIQALGLEGWEKLVL